MATTGLVKQDSLKRSSVCCIYTLSCCSHKGYTCTCVETGLVPGSPSTFRWVFIELLPLNVNVKFSSDSGAHFDILQLVSLK